MTEQFDPKHENCGTTECCMHCDTAYLGKDWYLTAINPWYKTFYNKKTKEINRIKIKDTNE